MRNVGILGRGACVFFAMLMIFTPILVKAVEPQLPVGGTVKALYLMEAEGGLCILEQESETPYPVAGLSRLPVLLLICEAIDGGLLSPEDTITVTDLAAGVKGPTAFLSVQETIAAKELLKAAVMIGAGDAITALALRIYGTEQAALQALAKRLEELEINAAYSSLKTADTPLSARALAKVGAKLAKSPSFRQYSSLYLDGITHADGRYTELVNPNRMVKNYAGCFGVATGSSNEAGYCGVFAISRSDTVLVAVLIGAQNSKERFGMAQAVFDYAASNCQFATLAVENAIMAQGVPVAGGTIRRVDLAAQTTVTLMLEKGVNPPEPVLQVVEPIPAPFAAGDVLGSIAYTDADGNVVASLPLVAATGCESAGYGDYFSLVCLDWIRA